MIGSGVSRRRRPWFGLCLGLLTSAIAGVPAAHAVDCPGHVNAIGTSRTIVVDPHEHPRIGTMQYRETLPLRDHEVVLTFDDGPLPKNSNQVLQILADECIKATFFVIGNQAKANPEGVRKLVAAGHTVGSHSLSHPLTFNKMPMDKAQAEIEGGIAQTAAAMTDPFALAPFFRIPGLLRAEGVENYLASRGIQVWSADFPADDWRHISSERVHQLAIQRLEAHGKGILLLHDIQARTVAALPKIIQDLKLRGYRIVHVVPATDDRPATPTEPVEWLMHPPSENVPIAHWPKVPKFAFARTETLPAPSLAGLNAELPRQAPLRAAALAHTESLPVPGKDLFEIKEGSVELLLVTAASRRATKVAAASTAEKTASHAAKRHGRAAAHGVAHAHGGRPAAKRAANDSEPAMETVARPARVTRVASLRKRQQ